MIYREKIGSKALAGKRRGTEVSRAGRIAGLWIATTFVAACIQLPVAAPAHADRTATCGESGFAVLASPLAPWKGAPLRVVVTTESRAAGELTLVAPDGRVATRSGRRFGGPPYSWFVEVAKPEAGGWQAKLTRSGVSGDCATVTQTITVQKSKGGSPRATSSSVWPVRDSWTRANENLYSAWIEKLFDAPLDENLSWKALNVGLNDPTRNFLYNHLNAGEDDRLRVVRPDCADLPYFLRAYFSFKMGLPFGYAKCTRGGGGKPPRCPQWWNIVQQEREPEERQERKTASNSLFGLLNGGGKKVASAAPATPSGLVPAFSYFLRTTLANAVHSGSGRTAAADNRTDYYPVSLRQETLRPGTIYADPYGHILVLVRRVPQTSDGAGIFLAVDGQPDGTVARKRFWRGNFLFSDDASLGSPGFKRFRPVVSDGRGGMRRLSNQEIAKNADYGDVSLEQTKLSVEAFYDRMDDVMSPDPLDPMRAMKDTITSLEEQVVTRVTSVENGRKYLAGGGGVAAMPDGARIFETTGAWEDFATPSRDLRLLIAIDVVRRFPDRVVRRLERYAMPKDKTVADVKEELDRVLSSELAGRKFTYTRTDGSPWELSLQDVVDRMPALEMAYNVNDCVELRWGAPAKGEEAKPCGKHAPSEQRAKMAKYREWFHERRRPPR
jgi:hypothetical protein